MGAQQSKTTNEKVVEKAIIAIHSDDRRITLRFPGFQDGDAVFLQNSKLLSQLFTNITPTLVDKLALVVGLPVVIGSTIVRLLQLRIIKSPDYIEKALTEIDVDQKIAQNAQSFVKAELSSIERQLQLYSDSQLSNEQKKTCLVIADHACYQLLDKFCDQDFYLRKYPLVCAPLLVNFVAVYVPIAMANLQLVDTEQRREDAQRNMTRLRDLVRDFREEAIKERLKHIVIFRDLDTSGKVPITEMLKLQFKTHLLSDPIFLMDTYRANLHEKYKPVYVFDSENYEASWMVYLWHRRQAKLIYWSYFVQPLQSIELFL